MELTLEQRHTLMIRIGAWNRAPTGPQARAAWAALEGFVGSLMEEGEGERKRLAERCESLAWMYDRTAEENDRQRNEIGKLRGELECERLRLAACGVVALANTRESAARARDVKPEYRSASLDGVARTVDREMALRAERDEAQRNYEGACKTVAEMHAAAIGEVGSGPRRGVVEDVVDLRAERDDLRNRLELIETACTAHRVEVTGRKPNDWHAQAAEELARAEMSTAGHGDPHDDRRPL